MKQRSFFLLFFIILTSNVIAQTITTNGFTFNPDTLYVNEGDTINFNLSNSHNAIEVDEATFLSNGNTSNSGFNIPFGGGTWISDSIQTYYYVCQPHASMGMKGVIISSCNKTLTQNLKGFSPNPVPSLWVWSYDTLTVTNTSNCEIRVRPEFTISGGNGQIDSADFNLKLYNTLLGNWPEIPYKINANGDAYGYLGIPIVDSTGLVFQPGASIELIIKVRFRPGADNGNYCCLWEAQEVNSSGNIIQNLTSATTCLALVNCNNFAINNSYSSDITCFNANDGNAGILSIQYGSTDYLYNWNNGDTTSSISNLDTGNYYCIVTDKNWQECSDSIGFSITQPSEITIGLTSTDLTTTGANDGTITALVNGGFPPYIYNWTGPNGYSNTGGQTNINGLATGVYNLSVTDDSLCSTTASEVINDPGCNIIINSSYTQPLCYQDSGSISWGNSNGIGPYLNQLTDSTGTVVYSGNNVNVSIAVSAGAYDLVVTDGAGCNEILNFAINQPNPLLVNIWIDGSSLASTTGFTNYQWYTSSGMVIPGATSEIYNPTSMGEYYVIVSDGDCEKISSTISYNINAINDLNRNIKIYPNPTNGLLTIEGAKLIENITLTNSTGNQLLKVENNNNKAGSAKLDLSTFTKGMYFIQIEQNSQIINYRIILQ